MTTSFSSEKDDNFCLPIPDVLENERVRLVPFIPAQHAEALFEAFDGDDSIWDHMPAGPYQSAEDFVETYWEKARANRASTTFVILDKIGPLAAAKGEPVIAGMVSYINTSDADACTELGFIVVGPAFRRSHVTSNMVGLLLHYALDLPEAGGLGLRRVQWICGTRNAPSLRTAERMGFRFEGVLRWSRVMAASKAGCKPAPERKGDPRAGTGGRDSMSLSCCFDDWEAGTREWVDQVMARTK